MPKYMQKPIVIDAFQFTGDCQAVFDWVGQWHDEGDGDGPGMSQEELAGEKVLKIDWGLGEDLAAKGDWIVRGVAGWFRVYTNEAFEQTYILCGDESCKRRNKGP